jgi:hypothetical protein
MTAPCYHTGKKGSAGNELVECKCPVYDGPFELGQAGVPCDANELTPSTTRTPLTTRMPATAWQYTLRVDPATLENVRLSFAQESSGAGQPDRAQVEEVLTKAGVDPGDVQSFMARFLPPIQEQGYSDFYNGNQSDGSRPPDSAAALTQFNILIDAAYASAAYSSKPKAPPVYVWSAAHNPKKNPEPIDPRRRAVCLMCRVTRAARSILRSCNIQSLREARSAGGYATPTATASARARSGRLRASR